MSGTILSAGGLERAATTSDSDFAFIGNGCQLGCTQFQAAFISPRVHLLVQEDVTIQSLFLEFQTYNVSEKRIFELLGRLVNGLPIDLRGSEVDAVREMAGFLGNIELLNQFSSDATLISKSNVCSRLRNKSAAGRSVDSEIEFASSHFWELDFEELQGIDVSILERIVSSQSLCLSNEDSLLSFICGLDSTAQIVLRRYLRSEYLSCEGIGILLDCVGDSLLDPFIWDCLCQRLRLPISPKQCSIGASTVGQQPPQVIEIPGIALKTATLQDGIISYLSKKCGGNVHDKGIVTITSNRFASPELYGHPGNVADLNRKTCFAFVHVSGLWICWDFHTMRLRPSHYTIAAWGLSSWILEGSVDGASWTQIDRQRDHRGFSGFGTNIISFPVSTTVECRRLRLTETDTKAQLTPVTCFAVEFFGTIFE
jgi:hypothetical protein